MRRRIRANNVISRRTRRAISDISASLVQALRRYVDLLIGRLGSGFSIISLVGFMVSDYAAGCGTELSMPDGRASNAPDYGSLYAALRKNG